MTTVATVSKLQVFATPTDCEAPLLPIVLSRRSTDKNPVPEHLRYRAIHVPESAMAIASDACQSKFSRLLQTTIHDLASKMFAEEIKAEDKREVDAARYSLDGILAYWAEEKQRQQIDAEAIKAWLLASATYAGLDSKKQKAWLELVPKLHATRYRAVLGPTLEKQKTAATVLLARLQDADLEHPVCMFIADRMNATLDATESEGKTEAANAL